MLSLVMANARNNSLEMKIPSPTMNFKQRKSQQLLTDLF